MKNIKEMTKKELVEELKERGYEFEEGAELTEKSKNDDLILVLEELRLEMGEDLKEDVEETETNEDTKEDEKKVDYNGFYFRDGAYQVGKKSFSDVHEAAAYNYELKNKED